MGLAKKYNWGKALTYMGVFLLFHQIPGSSCTCSEITSWHPSLPPSLAPSLALLYPYLETSSLGNV
jgi:hypothetical protein